MIYPRVGVIGSLPQATGPDMISTNGAADKPGAPLTGNGESSDASDAFGVGHECFLVFGLVVPQGLFKLVSTPAGSLRRPGSPARDGGAHS